jgi:hypothetical protein
MPPLEPDIASARLVEEISCAGATIKEISANLAEAVAKAAGDRDTVFVGPFVEVADDGDFGIYLALAHPGSLPLLYLAHCIPAATDVAKADKARARSAIVTGLSRHFRRVQPQECGFRPRQRAAGGRGGDGQYPPRTRLNGGRPRPRCGASPPYSHQRSFCPRETRRRLLSGVSAATAGEHADSAIIRAAAASCAKAHVRGKGGEDPAESEGEGS